MNIMSCSPVQHQYPHHAFPPPIENTSGLLKSPHKLQQQQQDQQQARSPIQQTGVTRSRMPNSAADVINSHPSRPNLNKLITNYPTKGCAAMSPSSPLDSTDKISLSEIQLSSETLGSGSYGTVYKARWRGKLVAVKQFKTSHEIDSFLVEVKQLSCIKHPNIVTLYGATTHIDTAYLIMEYAEGGSLNHLLHEQKQQQYDLRHACSWAMQTARGVAYLHEYKPKPIMHRDLKPANLLLFSRGKILKICDFGTACAVQTQMTNNTGSAPYMAPEVFATDSYSESGDVFSWSIIFWEILARRSPYAKEYQNPFRILYQVKEMGLRPAELENCPPIIWNLITDSWHKDSKKRPTMRRVADRMEFIFRMTEKPTVQSSHSTAASTTISASSPSPLATPTSPNCSPIMDPMSKLYINEEFSRQSRLANNPHSQNNFHLSSSSNFIKRAKYYHSKALMHQLVLLQRRPDELNRVMDCDRKITQSDLLDEYIQLKKETIEKKNELMLRQAGTISSRGHVDS